MRSSSPWKATWRISQTRRHIPAAVVRGRRLKIKNSKIQKGTEDWTEIPASTEKGTEAAVAETTVCCCVTAVSAVSSSYWPKQILTNLPERDNTFCLLHAQIIQIFFLLLLKLETLVSKLHCSLETEIRLKMGRPWIVVIILSQHENMRRHPSKRAFCLQQDIKEFPRITTSQWICQISLLQQKELILFFSKFEWIQSVENLNISQGDTFSFRSNTHYYHTNFFFNLPSTKP